MELKPILDKIESCANLQELEETKKEYI